MPAPPPQSRLNEKLFWMAIVFFVVALGAVGLTLYASWKLEGGAAVINEMGSERMRVYRIAYLLADDPDDPDDQGPVRREQLRAEVRKFEEVMIGIKSGNPARPLVLPRDPEILALFSAAEQRWFDHVKPLIFRAVANDASLSSELGRIPHTEIEGFVDQIDQIVRMIEAHNSRNIALLRYMQFGLIVLALVGTLALIYLMSLLVVRPVASLADGMRRMTAGEFSTRVPVDTQDEFGDLAEGFNRMASRLQDLYGTLEERVADKTRDLATRNRELAALYEMARLLNEHVSTEELCRGFLRRLMTLHGATGGAVRLMDEDSRQLHLYAHEGLSGDFASQERCIDLGECLCGTAAKADRDVVEVLSEISPDLAIACRKAGHRTVAVFPIRSKRKSLGIFNLYFPEPHPISLADRLLLDTLGQHLGVAIENQRLASRDREFAVYEERSLLASELHDSIAQSLAFLNIQVQMLEDSLERGARGEIPEVLNRIREGVRESYDDVRELMTHFRMRVNQEEEIGVTLRRMLERFSANSGIATEFVDTGTGVSPAAEIQLQILHILQEALSNVRKHAHATRVEFSIHRGVDYRFSVTDDGDGFDVKTAVDTTEAHIGLRIIRERAQRIGAQIDIASRSGAGTTVTLTLPVVQGAGDGLEIRHEAHA